MSNKCKGCGAEIRWVKMETGGSMPLDAKSVKMVHVVPNFHPEHDIYEAYMVDVYMPHWATCPKAKDFK